MEQKNEKSGVSRNKVLQVIASILVAVAIWVYVDVEKAPERTKTIRDIPVEFSGESTTLADKNLMLLSGYDTTVDLTIKGTKRELVKINKDNVRLVASTSSIDSVGVHQLDWTVSFPDGVVSFSLITGSAPSSSSRKMVLRMLRLRRSFFTSSPVSSTCATVWLYSLNSLS